MNIEDLRGEIDAIDNDLAQLFLRRMETVSSVAEYKIENGLPVFSPGREQSIIERLTANSAPETADSLSAFYKRLFEISRAYQIKKMSKFGLLGGKLGHSLSPEIHSMLGDYEYSLCPTEADKVVEFFERNELAGFNVTIPYKTEAFRHCSALSETALKTGSVNTVLRQADGSFFGDNTDCFGFKKLLEKHSCDPKGEKVVILGSGGSSKTVKAVFEELSAGEIVVVSRTGEENYTNIYRHYDARIIVNTTPVGMYPNTGESPLNLGNFKNCAFVFDLIYNPARTALIQQAEEMGITAVNGLYMLTAQAWCSAQIFGTCGKPFEAVDKITSEIEKRQKNILFVGMPGSGKSTIARLLSGVTGRKLIDTDAIIENENGSIPEIFEKQGEHRFRDIESAVIKKACSGPGAVIAVGGGAVLRKENIIAMRENSVVIFLDRPLNELATDGRPLSSGTAAPEKLYAGRIGLYKTAADFTVNVCSDAEETLRRVRKCVYL